LKRILPNFIIIGASKAGTTSVYHYMKQHPQIFMCPVKEPRYLAYTGEQNDEPPGLLNITYFPIKTLEEYLDLYKGVKDELIIGEASPIYLASPAAAGRIKELMPEAKMLAILRNPVETAFSMHMMLVRRNIIPYKSGDDFSRVFTKDSPIVTEGFYHQHLKHYLAFFSKEQIKIHLYNHFKQNPLSVIQDVYSFLGVDPSFIPDLSVQHNVGGIPRNKRLNMMMFKIQRLWNKKAVIKLRGLVPDYAVRKYWSLYKRNLNARIDYPPELRRQLAEIYRQDILKLQELIQQDLSAWLAF
jgi:hypothetical protein